MNAFERRVAVCILAAFSIALLWLANSAAVNAPNADDFDILLAALIRFDDAATFSEKIATIFMRHGEHYVVFARLLAIAQTQIFGQINFAALLIFGAAAPIVTVALFCKLSDLELCQGTLAAAIIMLLPQYVESLAWASGGLQHLWVWPFFLAAYLAAQNEAIFLALIFSVAACFTQGNGILAFPLCALSFSTKRNWIGAILFAAFSFAALFLHTGSATDAANLLSGDTPIASYLRYCCAMIGAPLARTYSSAIVAGAIIIPFSLVLLSMRRSWKVSSICCLALTVLLTAPLNALARIRFGESYGFEQSRYTYPSLILLGCILVLSLRLVEKLQLRIGLNAAITMALSCWLVLQSRSYSNQFQLRKDIMTQSLLRRAVSDQGFEYPNQTRALDLIHTAEERGYYIPPNVSLTPYMAEVDLDSIDTTTIAPKMAIRLEQNLLGPNQLYLSGYAYDRSHKEPPSEITMVFRDASESLVFSARAWQRPDVAAKHPIAPLNSGFVSVIPRSILQGHTWNISIRLKFADKSIEHPLSKLDLGPSNQA